jgi:hypothetical protein
MRRPGALLGGLLATFGLVALAHVPWRLEADRPVAIATPELSGEAMAVFVTGEEVFVATFTYARPFGAPVEVLVPREAALAEHRPAWALVGPGLPLPTDAERAVLPRPLPDGFGAIVELNEETPREALFESVMRRFYWTSRPLAVVFPAGTSEVWVWSPAKTTGKFGLAFGVEEGGDYLAIFDDWSLYAY